MIGSLVAIHSYNHQDTESIDDLSKTLLAQFEDFVLSYNQRGKNVRIKGIGGPEEGYLISEAGHQEPFIDPSSAPMLALTRQLTTRPLIVGPVSLINEKIMTAGNMVLRRISPGCLESASTAQLPLPRRQGP
jgi:hypothetical protein